MIPSPASPPNPVWIAIGISALGVVVTVIGWFVVNELAKSREKNRDAQAIERAALEAKEKRRLEFLAFLKKWRTDIFSPPDDKLGVRYDLSSASVSAYQNELSSFNSQAVLVQNDFTDRQRFDFLTDRIAGLKSEQWNKKMPRDVICGTIDELIQFVGK